MVGPVADMTTPPPKAPFKPAVATNTPNPAKLPEQRPASLTEADKERAHHERTRRALAETQEQALKHATDAAFKAGQLDQRGKGRLQHYLEAYAQVIACLLIVAFAMVIVRQGDSWVGWLAVKNHEQAVMGAQMNDAIEPGQK